MKKKVTIQLTSDQREKIKVETGKDLTSLEFEPLENRDAPSVFSGRGGKDGMHKLDPEP